METDNESDHVENTSGQIRTDGMERAIIFDRLDYEEQNALLCLASLIFNRQAEKETVKDLALRVAPFVEHFAKYESFGAYINTLIENTWVIEGEGSQFAKRVA